MNKLHSELQELFLAKRLSEHKAYDLLRTIAENQADPNLISSFLTVFQMRQLTLAEAIGFKNAMLDLAVNLDLSEFDPLDLCGSGGDGKDSFNISTASAFVVAACGVAVAKHGNYGMSSKCGSSNVLEALGLKFTNHAPTLIKQLRKANLCFLHAPLFHPAMKGVAPIRKALGFRTLFNFMGPLVNPCRPRKQLLGVASLNAARLYTYLLQQEKIEFMVVHSLDGYDEISLSSPFKVTTNCMEKIFYPQELGIPLLKNTDLTGGTDAISGAEILLKILKGEGSTAQTAVVAANAGFTLHLANPNLTIHEGIRMARDAIINSTPYLTYRTLLEIEGYE